MWLFISPLPHFFFSYSLFIIAAADAAYFDCSSFIFFFSSLLSLNIADNN
jgi:hypothetical protein